MMKDKVKKTMQLMDKAYTLLGRIPVTGDSVDVMALVRMELRTAYAEQQALLDELATQQKQEGTDGQTDRG